VAGHGRFDVSPRAPGGGRAGEGAGRLPGLAAHPACPAPGAPPAGRFLLPRAAYSPGRAGGEPRVFLLTAVAAGWGGSPALLSAFLDHYAALGVAAQHTLVLAQSSGGAEAEAGLAELQALADGRSVFLDVWVGPLPPASALAARWRALLGRHGRRGDWAFVFDADELALLPPGQSLPALARQAAALGYDGLLALRAEETRAGGSRDAAAQQCAVGEGAPCAGAPRRAPLLVGALGAAALPRLRPLLDVGFDDAAGAAPPGAPYPVPLALRHAGWGGGAGAAAEAARRADALAACLGEEHAQATAARERARLLASDGGWLTRGACPVLACAAAGAEAGAADSPLASALAFASGGRRVAVVSSVWEHVDGVSKTLQTVSGQLLGARLDTRVLLLTPDVGGGSLRRRALDAAAAAAAARLPGLAVVAIPSLPAPGRPDYRWAPPLPRRAAAQLALFAPDAVHAAAPDFLGHSALAWARAHGVCSLCTYHTAFPTYLQYYGAGFAEPLVARFVASFYARCDYVAVPTHAAADDLAAAGVPRDKMGFFPRGVNGSLYSPTLRSEAWRRDVALAAEGELVVLWVRSAAPRRPRSRRPGCAHGAREGAGHVRLGAAAAVAGGRRAPLPRGGCGHGAGPGLAAAAAARGSGRRRRPACHLPGPRARRAAGHRAGQRGRLLLPLPHRGLPQQRGGGDGQRAGGAGGRRGRGARAGHAQRHGPAGATRAPRTRRQWRGRARRRAAPAACGRAAAAAAGRSCRALHRRPHLGARGGRFGARLRRMRRAQARRAGRGGAGGGAA